VALFHRHARGLLLTEQGEMLYRTVHEVFAKLEMAQARLRDSTDRPQGPLKVTTTVAFGSLWLTPRVREFLELYPDIELTMIATDQDLDLGMRQADCAIRMTPPTQPDLIQRRLTQVHGHLFASPEYIKEHGMPASVDEFDSHRLIIYGEDAFAKPPVPNMNWLLDVGRHDRPRRPVLKINNVYGILARRAVGPGHRRHARLPGQRGGQPGARAAGPRRTDELRQFRLPAGVQDVAANRRVPRLRRAESRRVALLSRRAEPPPGRGAGPAAAIAHADARAQGVETPSSYRGGRGD